MEEDVRSLKSPILSEPEIERELVYLKNAVDQSKKRIDFTTAHDPDVQKAIRVVERFLRKHKRVCYGGTAINALLPNNLKFYNPKYEIPDYDMFTPDVKGDIEALIKDLHEEGFTDVNQKIGIHEGTRKVLVNYIPVADFTEMHEVLFRTIRRRAFVIDGIYYCDPEFLRMLMYLELSRPRGQVDRWEKVFERLMALEKAHPMRPCRQSVLVPHVDETVRKTILEFISKRKRVLAGVETVEYYEKAPSRVPLRSLVEAQGVVLFFSPEAKHDAEDLSDILGHSTQYVKKEALADDFFDCYMIRYERRPIALIVQERACHSYIEVSLDTGAKIRLASLDLLMNLYLSFVVFGKKEEKFLQVPILCLAELAHGYLRKYRHQPTKHIPAFTVSCSGKQKGFASLQKERAERTEKVKKGNTKTKKTITGGSIRRKTRRNRH
jgi:hypothetical protein